MSFVFWSIAIHVHASPQPALLSACRFFCLQPTKLQISSHWICSHVSPVITRSAKSSHASPNSTKSRETVRLLMPVIRTGDRMLLPSTRHASTRQRSVLERRFIVFRFGNLSKQVLPRRCGRNASSGTFRRVILRLLAPTAGGQL